MEMIEKIEKSVYILKIIINLLYSAVLIRCLMAQVAFEESICKEKSKIYSS